MEPSPLRFPLCTADWLGSLNDDRAAAYHLYIYIYKIDIYKTYKNGRLSILNLHGAGSNVQCVQKIQYKVGQHFIRQTDTFLSVVTVAYNSVIHSICPLRLTTERIERKLKIMSLTNLKPWLVYRGAD